MIKMIIVDDEPIILQGLEETVPWGNYGVQVVDTAQDGEETLEKIALHQGVDLVITDVKMPNMDGIELTELLSKEENPPKMIIISGYDDFDYAQQAIKYGVKDYLLKPVDIDKLIQTVQRVKLEIEMEKETREKLTELTVRSTIIRKITGTTNLTAESNLDRIVFPVLISVQNYMNQMDEGVISDRDPFQFALQEQVSHLFKNVGMNVVTHFFTENVLLVCIYSWNNDSPTKEQLHNILNELQNDPVPYHFVINEGLTKIRNLTEVYDHLYHSLQLIYLKNSELSDRYLTHKDFSELLKEDVVISVNKAWEDVEKAVSKLFDRFYQEIIILDQVNDICREILFRVEHTYEKGINSDSFMNLDLHFLEKVDINLYNSYELLKKTLLDDLDSLYEMLHPKDNDSHHWLVDRALSYINQYYNYDIKASEVADYINISPNYFSAVFKQYTGRSFNDYLNELRVEKAKVLLEQTQDKVVSIAEQVGYQNYKYFVQIFKQRTARTPTEYRKLTSG